MNPNRYHGSSNSFGLCSILQTLLEVLGMIPVRQPAFVRRTILWGLAIAIVTTSAGCGLPAKWHLLAKKLPEATPEDPAYQMLCVWEAAEGIGPDNLPTRGFAGKITFFTRKQKTGVRVNGDVRVYVYDDQSPVEERGKPIHQWDFPGDAWSIHLQQSSLGPAYSVFIPYTRKGNHQALCALRVRFTPEAGTPMYSETVAVLLPGQVKKKQDRPLNAERLETKPSLTSITIPLKEKRRNDWTDRPLGQTELERTVAPVSELIKTQPELLHPFDSHRAVDDGRTSVITSLPAPPPSTTPAVMPPAPAPPRNPFEDLEPKHEAVMESHSPPPAPRANPFEEKANPFEDEANPFEAFGASFKEHTAENRQHPLLGNDLESGSNPFNR